MSFPRLLQLYRRVSFYETEGSLAMINPQYSCSNSACTCVLYVMILSVQASHSQAILMSKGGFTILTQGLALRCVKFAISENTMFFVKIF